MYLFIIHMYFCKSARLPAASYELLVGQLRKAGLRELLALVLLRKSSVVSFEL